MLTQTRLHEKRHKREMRKRAHRQGVVQSRINRRKHKLRVDRQALYEDREKARREAAEAEVKQTQRLVAAKESVKAAGLFRRMLNKVRGRG